MNKERIKISLLIIAFIFAGARAYGQEEEKKESGAYIPAGMKLKQEGDVGILMPKDGILHRINGNIILMESTEEYTTRQILEMKSRLTGIEGALKEQKDEIKYLRITLDEIKRAQKDDLRSGDTGTAITGVEKAESR